MNPRLKQRKTRTTSGLLTRDEDDLGLVTLWNMSLHDFCLQRIDGAWYLDLYEACSFEGPDKVRVWYDDEFKSLYTGIPRKGRAVWVEIELVVD